MNWHAACRQSAMSQQTVQAKSYKVGDKEKFWILNSDTTEHSQIDATLRYITPHSYFWVEDGTAVNEGDMKALMDTFEEQDLSHRPRVFWQ